MMFSHNSLFYDLAFLMGPSQPDTIFLHSSPSWGMEVKPWCFLWLVRWDETHVTPYYCSPCFRWASRMVIHFLTVSQGVETSIFKYGTCNFSCAFKRSPAHSWRLSITGQAALSLLYSVWAPCLSLFPLLRWKSWVQGRLHSNFRFLLSLWDCALWPATTLYTVSLHNKVH